MIRMFRGEYKWLSNFASCKIILEGREYRSVEHAYMSAKSDEENWKDFCQKTHSAFEVKKASRTVELINGWNEKKLSIMRECLKQKFNQEPYHSLLIQTGEEIIEEGNDWNDTFWGVDIKTKMGHNNLGILIMKIRDNLWIEDNKFVIDAIFEDKEVDLYNDFSCEWERRIPTGFDLFSRVFFSGSNTYKLARVVPKKQFHYLNAIDQMKWLINNGYKPDENGNWLSEYEIPFVHQMWHFCGKPVVDVERDFAWHNEWLEEVEVDK